MKAIVMAGAKLREPDASELGLVWRCEVPVKGRPMVDHVLDALKPNFEPIVIGGPERHDVCWIEGGHTLLENFKKGLDATDEQRLMVVGSDIPFIQPEDLQRFYDHADPLAAINYPIVETSEIDRAFPGMKRTVLSLKEGTFTGGNAFVVDRFLMNRILPTIEKTFEARKSPIKLGQVLGMRTLMLVLKTQFFKGSVSISELESQVGKSLGAKVKAITGQAPAIAADIDTTEHFAWVRTL
ncbi:MAG: nucleotidyltransferase family protein [Armatimonadetes bacterium]|nr:nucleotidyltransferase family protein [Armatimonadota bacterium]